MARCIWRSAQTAWPGTVTFVFKSFVITGVQQYLGDPLGQGLVEDSLWEEPGPLLVSVTKVC